jgi:hypothetical protein
MKLSILILNLNFVFGQFNFDFDLTNQVKLEVGNKKKNWGVNIKVPINQNSKKLGPEGPIRKDAPLRDDALNDDTLNDDALKENALNAPIGSDMEEKQLKKRKIISVKVYEHWWYGKSEIIKMTKCKNLPNYLDNIVTSIDTMNNCVVVFADLNCKGRGVRVEHFSFGTDDLGRIGMNDVISSIRPC